MVEVAIGALGSQREVVQIRVTLHCDEALCRFAASGRCGHQ